MDKPAYIKYLQEEANNKAWKSLMDKYGLLKKKNIVLAYLWYFLSVICYGFIAIIGWIFSLTLLFKDTSFDLHYLKTNIESSSMNPEEIIQYLDSRFLDYKSKLSYGDIPLAKQAQIENSFEILYNQYILPEPDKKHEEIISKFTTLNQSIENTQEKVQNVSKDMYSLSSQSEEQTKIISADLSHIKERADSISQYTDRKLSEEQELEKRRIEKAQKEKSKYNREKGRNLDSFESCLSDEQINILVEYCNKIPVFDIEVTPQEMKAILMCTHTSPLQVTVNKYIALLFTRLCNEKLICETWKSVAMRHRCFISPNQKILTSKDLSSANATAGIIKPKVYEIIEECIEELKEV